MSTEMKKTEATAKKLFFIILGVMVLYFIVISLVNNKFSSLEQMARSQISDQQALISVIAETTARNGADTVTEAVIKDCSTSERARFEELLSNLNSGLGYNQLVELERLFGRCGSFYSERKAIMVSRLAREVEVYAEKVSFLATLLEEDVNAEFSIANWKKLVEEEQKQAELFSRLVVLQDEIITTLILGKSANSEEIKTILQQVAEVQETLIVTSKQAATTRADLINL